MNLKEAQKEECKKCIHKLYDKDPSWCYMFEKMFIGCKKTEYYCQEDSNE